MTDSTSLPPDGAPEPSTPAAEPLATATELDGSHQPQWWRRRRTVLVVTAAVIATGAGVLFWVVSLQPTKLESAVTSCKLESSAYAAIGDDGRTLTLDGASDAGGDGLEIGDTVCVLSELDASSAALAQMEGTNSLQGRQTASWDNVDASWTYHPDDGFDIILTTGST